MRDEAVLLTMTQLKERGWADALVKKFLDPPDATRPNPHYKSATPMRLYTASRVEAAESCEDWRRAAERSRVRSEAGKALAARKAAVLVKEAEQLPIAVTRLPLDQLQKRAIASYNAYHEALVWQRGHEYEKADAQSDPTKVSNRLLIQLHHAWVGFFEAMETWREHPEQFTGRPKLPGYKHKTAGRNLLVYEMGSIWKRDLDQGVIALSGLGALVQTAQSRQSVDEVRIVPKAEHYVIEVVYQYELEHEAAVDPELFVAADLGVNVLAALTSNKPGFLPRLASGKPIKSRNQYYNKQRARHQSHLAKQNRFTSRQLDRITTKRNRRIMHYLHTASRRIIDLLVQEGIGLLIIGKNPLWKQECTLGRKHNQEFVQMPHTLFIEMLQYKGALAGITVVIHEESYTSKASFLDLDDIPSYDPNRTEKPAFSGRRIARSWYRAANGQIIHADVNGSYNIGRKVAPTAFSGRGVGGAAVRPRRLAV